MRLWKDFKANVNNVDDDGTEDEIKVYCVYEAQMTDQNCWEMKKGMLSCVC